MQISYRHTYSKVSPKQLQLHPFVDVQRSPLVEIILLLVTHPFTPSKNEHNETVSVGDTVVSLHTRGGSILGSSKLKVPSLDQNFISGGRGGRGGGSLPRIGYSWQNEQKILHAQARS